MDDFLHNIQWVEALRQPWLTPVFELFSLCGYKPFFLLSLPVLYWAWDKQAGNRLAIVVLTSALLNSFFKDLFLDSRPLEFSIARIEPDSNGFPSGHAQLAVAFWGWLALEIRTRKSWIVALIFIVGICFSRLYLGVHDVEDVLGGAALGLVTLATFWGLFSRTKPIRSTWRLGWVALLLTITVLAWPFSETPSRIIVLAGFFFGWICGVELESKRIDFVKTQKWKSLVGAISGLVFTGVLMKVLEFLLKNSGLPPVIAGIIGGFGIGIFITCGVPALLIRMELLAPRGQRKMA